MVLGVVRLIPHPDTLKALYYSEYNMKSLHLVILTVIALTAMLSACTSTNIDEKIAPLNKTENKVLLNDIWMLENMHDSKLSDLDGIERPRLEVQLADMRIQGSDSCNHYFASIEHIDEEKITFGPIASTRKFCADMAVADSFSQHMNNVTSYHIENLTLTLFDAAGHEILLFNKID